MRRSGRAGQGRGGGSPKLFYAPSHPVREGSAGALLRCAGKSSTATDAYTNEDPHIACSTDDMRSPTEIIITSKAHTA